MYICMQFRGQIGWLNQISDTPCCSLRSINRAIYIVTRSGRESVRCSEKTSRWSELTNDDSRQKADRLVRRSAIWEEGFQNVGGECERHDGLGTGSDNHALHPQPDESQEGAKRHHDVGIVGPTFRNHAAQLGIAVGSHERKYARSGPHDESQVWRPRSYQDAGGSDENAGSDDTPHNDGDTVHEGHLRLETNGFLLVLGGRDLHKLGGGFLVWEPEIIIYLCLPPSTSCPASCRPLWGIDSYVLNLFQGRTNIYICEDSVNNRINAKCHKISRKRMFS